MVGVPGRSKGCQTCRKRKKKCDLQQPTCGNCIKGRFVCGGYQRELIMVHTDVSGKGSYKRPPDTRDYPSPVSQETSPSDKSSPADVRCRDLNRTVLELECLGAFINLYIPKGQLKGQQNSSPNMPKRIFQFTSMSSQSVASSDALRCAFLAVSASQVGQAKQDKQMLSRGMELYGKALCYMGNGIKGGKQTKQNDLVAMCWLLALYEQLDFTKTSEHGFKGHINGIVTLVQFYEPKTFASPQIHAVFCEARHQGILAALADRKKTFLSSHSWLTQPWHNRRKEAIDTATDIVAEIPTVFEEWDAICLDPQHPNSIERAAQLKAKCWYLDKQLCNWRADFPTSTSLYLTPKESNQLFKLMASAREQDLPGIIAQFGLPLLYSWAIYWSTCILLYRTMKTIYQVFPPLVDPLEDEALYLPRTDIVIHSLCIAKTAYFFLQPDLSGLAAMKCIIWPLDTARDVLVDQRIMFRKGECAELDEVETLLDNCMDMVDEMKYHGRRHAEVLSC